MTSDLVRDGLIGIRQLRRRPAWSVALLATLVLGIGATTAVFSVTHDVLLRPLPFAEPDRLISIWSTQESRGIDQLAVSDDDFAAFRERSRTLAGLEAAAFASFDVERDGFVEQVPGVHVSTGMFALLGIRPIAGRSFAAAEGGADPARVVMIGEREWRSRYGGDPALIGSAVRLSGEPYTVIGILPDPLPLAVTGGINRGEYWVPLGIIGGRGLAVVARLRPGVSHQAVQTDLAAIARERESMPNNEGVGVRIIELHEQTVGRARDSLRLLAAVVALVLLVACANAANLLFGQSAERQQEMAVRTALGAGRARLIRQVLHETLVLAAIAGVLGVLLASWITDLLVTRMPAQLPRMDNTRVDAVVLLFAAAASIVSVFAAGIFPALRASRSRPLSVMGSGARSGGTRNRLYTVTACVQVALAVVMVACAGLLLRSLVGIARVDPGIDVNGLVAIEARGGMTFGTAASRDAFVASVSAELQARPDVRDAAVVTPLPFGGTNVRAPAVDPMTGDSILVHLRAASPGWFGLAGLTLRRGRFIESTDVVGSVPVIVVTETVARLLWPGREALGQRIGVPIGPRSVDREVVGVIADERVQGPAQPPAPLVYIAFAQATPLRLAHVVIRRTGTAAIAADELRRVVGAAIPGSPVGQPLALADLLTATFAATRFYTFLLAVFSTVALLLAAIGVYGVIEQSVAQQRFELGVRQALGASRTDVARLILRRGLVIAGVGATAGLAAATIASRLLETLLYGVRPADPLTLVIAAIVVGAAALIATSLPARRAAALEPLLALREP